MYNVYEVYTWDDVDYEKVASFEKKEDAEKECERLKEERRKLNIKPDSITYCVMDNVQYHLLMKN